MNNFKQTVQAIVSNFSEVTTAYVHQYSHWCNNYGAEVMTVSADPKKLYKIASSLAKKGLFVSPGGSHITVYSKTPRQMGFILQAMSGSAISAKTAKRVSRALMMHNPRNVFRGKYEIRVVEDKPQLDGAMIVSRELANKMNVPSYLKRVGITAMTKDGQIKGHALITEESGMFLEFNNDYKTEVLATEGNEWIAAHLWYGKSKKDFGFFMDVQSAANLLPWMSWEASESVKLTKELFDFIGSDPDRLGDHFLDQNPEEGFGIGQLIARGLKPSMDQAITRQLLNMGLGKMLESRNEGARILVPGCTAYIMSEMLGVKAGHIKPLDGKALYLKESNTLYIPDELYVEVAGSLGGADLDDSVWMMNTEDGILVWRSPNAAGESFVLPKHEDGDKILFLGNEYKVAFDAPKKRTKQANPPFVASKPEGIMKPLTQSSYMDWTVQTTQRLSKIAYLLGWSVNLMMASLLQEADSERGWDLNWLKIKNEDGSWSQLKLEDIIDAIVKTGDDISGLQSVLQWMQNNLKKDALRSGEYSQLALERIGAIRVDELWKKALGENPKMAEAKVGDYIFMEPDGSLTDPIAVDKTVWSHEIILAAQETVDLFNEWAKELVAASDMPAGLMEYLDMDSNISEEVRKCLTFGEKGEIDWDNSSQKAYDLFKSKEDPVEAVLTYLAKQTMVKGSTWAILTEDMFTETWTTEAYERLGMISKLVWDSEEEVVLLSEKEEVAVVKTVEARQAWSYIAQMVYNVGNMQEALKEAVKNHGSKPNYIQALRNNAGKLVGKKIVSEGFILSSAGKPMIKVPKNLVDGTYNISNVQFTKEGHMRFVAERVEECTT